MLTEREMGLSNSPLAFVGPAFLFAVVAAVIAAALVGMMML